MESSPRLSSIVVLLLYGVLTLLMSWPLALNLADHAVGSGGDPWQTLWRFTVKADLVKQAFSQGTLGATVIKEFGGGAPQLVNLSVWPWLPLHFLFGQPLTYNLIWILSTILSGFGTYALMLWLFARLKQSEWVVSATSAQFAAALAGLIYMFLPFRIAHSFGHFGAMQTQWIPFIVLTFLSLITKPSWWKAVVLAALVTIQAWTEHHYMLWLIILFVIWLAWHGRGLRSSLHKVPIGHLAAVGALLVILVIVPYWPTIRLASQSSDSLALGTSQAVRFSLDPFSLIIPAFFHPIWGGLSSLVRTNGNVIESTHFLGWILILLLLFFHHRIPRNQKKWWLTIAFIFFVLSLGPRLRLMGYVTAIPLPYALIDSLPPFNAVRAVGRAGVMTSFALVILFGWIVGTHLKRTLTAFIIAGVVLIEFLFMPVPFFSTEISPVYSAVRTLPGDALVELPAATNYVAASRALYASTIHHKEVLGSIALERGQDPEQAGEIRSIPGLRKLLYVQSTDLLENRQEFFGQNLAEVLLDTLHWQKASTIIVHYDSLASHQQAAVKQFLENTVGLVPQLKEDSTLYTTDTAKQTSDGVFLVRGPGWDRVGYNRQRQSFFAEIPKQAYAELINTTPTPRHVTLELMIAEESPAGVRIESPRLGVIAEKKEPGPLAVSFTAPPGETELVWRSLGTEKSILQNPTLTVAHENTNH